MSTNKIDEMTESEAKDLLNEISNIFKIGGAARTKSAILSNIKNADRRADCLSLIEREFTYTEIDEDGEEVEQCDLNWGKSPDEYIVDFKALIDCGDNQAN